MKSSNQNAGQSSQSMADEAPTELNGVRSLKCASRMHNVLRKHVWWLLGMYSTSLILYHNYDKAGPATLGWLGRGRFVLGWDVDMKGHKWRLFTSVVATTAKNIRQYNNRNNVDILGQSNMTIVKVFSKRKFKSTFDSCAKWNRFSQTNLGHF